MRLIALAAALAAVPAFAAEQRYDVGAFKSVVNETAPDVVVHVGGATKVWAEGDAQTIADLIVRVEDDRLVVKSRPGARWRGKRERTTVHVVTPSLASAIVSASGNILVDRVTGPGFRGQSSGSGDVRIGELKTETASLSTHGSGNVIAAGAVGRLDASSNGSGNVDARKLVARSAGVRTTGSGNVDAFASEEAEVFATGSGNATVTGTRTCRVRSTGSGGARCG